MEEKQSSVLLVTLVLTIIAGYCDTITFVAADKIFSAHVTGNFIVFAYQMVKGSDGDAWIKLMTFPVFMFSVMTGGWIGARFANRHFLLFCEGLVLIFGGIIAYVLGSLKNGAVTWPMYLVTMIVVFAMGLQNAYGKLFAKDKLGPTTMMTGNVTQIALDIRGMIMTGFNNADIVTGFKKGLVMIGGFLIGCVLGAYVGKLFGLVGIVLPGLSMAICYCCTNRIKSRTS